MGHWLHGKRSSTSSGMAEFGASATIDHLFQKNWLEIRRDWFRDVLSTDNADNADRSMDKSIDNSVLAKKNNYFFWMGSASVEGNKNFLGGNWENTDFGFDSQSVKMYCHSDGVLHDGEPRESSAAAPAPLDLGRSITSDPFNPFPSLGGAITSGNNLIYYRQIIKIK